MRSFPFRYQRRALTISVTPTEHGWELWISEGDRRLAYGGRLSADDAVEAWRRGEDRMLTLAEEVKSHILTGKLVLHPQVAPDPPGTPLPARS
jgi:hypothetical protein